MNEMTTKEFLDEYRGSSYGLEEIADIAQSISDDNELREYACAFVRAQVKLEKALKRIGFEVG